MSVSPERSESQMGMRKLRTKVAKLVETEFLRCRACVKRRTVTSLPHSCAEFLSQCLPHSEFLTVSQNPKYFLKDDSLRTSLSSLHSPSWDYLLTHFPPEELSLNMFIRRLKEERRRRTEAVQVEKRRKAEVAEEKRVAKSAVASKRALASIERHEKQSIAAQSFIRNLDIPSPSLGFAASPDLFHRIPRTQSGDNLFTREVTFSASPKHRVQTAKSNEFKEAILRKNPFQAKSPASQMVDVENKREKRRERVERMTEILHETLRLRQLEVMRRKDDIEHKRELERKRLEMSIAHKERKKNRGREGRDRKP